METSKELIIPNSLKSQVPIFGFLGDKIQTATKTPQGKAVATVGAIGILGGLSYAFFSNLSVITVGLMGVLGVFAEITALGVFVILGGLFLWNFNRIVNGLNNMVRVKGHGIEKRFVRKNFMDQLSIIMEDAMDTMKSVREKINQVVASKLKVIAKSNEKNEESKNKYDQVKRINSDVKKLESDIAEWSKKPGYQEKVNQLKRERDETLVTATLRLSEAKSAEDSAKLYAQCGNQISKVVEILKDNESAAKIYVGAIKSSIQIIQEKVEVTNDINQATKNLAEAFQIKDGWMFMEAMDAAQTQISSNIANIRGNLQFVDENRGAIAGTMSSEELNNFTLKLESGTMKTLNVAEVTDSNHVLSQDEIVSPDLTIL